MTSPELDKAKAAYEQAVCDLAKATEEQRATITRLSSELAASREREMALERERDELRTALDTAEIEAGVSSDREAGMLTEYDRERTQRNLHPHAEARMAMALWSHEYAFEQRGGSMDFWDSRTPSQKRLCIEIVNDIVKAHEAGRRALSEHGEEPE